MATWIHGRHFKLGNKALLSPCKIACRIDGKYTAEMIRSLTSIDANAEIAPSKSMGGFAKYISTHMYCKKCKSPLRLSKGKSGKTILRCPKCKEPSLLPIGDVNHYINMYGVDCPICGERIKAGVGTYGIYVRCEEGHFPKLEDI